MTRSWEISIDNAVREINKINQRRKFGGFYLNQAELSEILQQGYQVALKRAALEAFEGRYETAELATMVNESEILAQTLQLIQQ